MELLRGKYYWANGAFHSNINFDFSNIKSGDSIYEVVRIEDAIPLFWEDHLARFQKSIRFKNAELHLTPEFIYKGIEGLIQKNEIETGNIKIIFNKKPEPLLLIYFIPHYYPDEESYHTGIKTVMLHAERHDPNYKVVNQELRTKADNLKEETGAYEVLLVNNDGFITEGSKSNVFAIKEDIIYTSPVNSVLPGITRMNVIEICRKFGFKVIETPIDSKLIYKMDGVFITGTSPRVLPVYQINDFVFVTENILLKNIMEAFKSLVKGYIFKGKM